jgi:hypothetical protein
MNSDLLNLIASLLSGVVGGVIVAVVNYYLTKRKTMAEVSKIEAETEKTRAETQKLLSEVEDISATVGYKLNSSGERIIYNSSADFDPHDFKGVEGQVWNSEQKKHIGPKGRGALSFEQGGVLNIRRAGVPGRYEVWLQRYMYDGVELTHIPKNEIIAGKRKLHISCQAKAIGSEHSLDFVIKEEKTGSVPAHNKQKILGNNSWMPIDLYFQVSPIENYIFRIYDQDIGRIPTSVQIRNLVIAERVS